MMKALFENTEENGNFPLSILDLRRKPLLSVILPAYNEEETIREVVIEYFQEIVTKLPSEFVVAEDGSIDRTPEILSSLAKEFPISLFSDPKRKGYAKGVADALKNCGQEWIFFSDSDGQYSSSDFWSLWENRKDYDMIIGRKLRRNEGFHRILLSKCFHIIFNKLFGLKLHDADCGFRLIRKEVISSILDETKIMEFSFWAEFTIRACLKGFNVLEIPINHTNRLNGRTRIYSISKLPLIVLKQLRGLASLFADIRSNSLSGQNMLDPLFENRV
jgi:dolichol-phosphate mannosyltransferase